VHIARHPTLRDRRDEHRVVPEVRERHDRSVGGPAEVFGERALIRLDPRESRALDEHEFEGALDRRAIASAIGQFEIPTRSPESIAR